MPTSLPWLSVLALGACIPPGTPPTVPLPPISDDTRIVGNTRIQRENEVRAEVDGRSCSTATGECIEHQRDVGVQVDHSYTVLGLTSGEQLDLAQLEVLGDRERPAKLDELASLNASCRRGKYWLGAGAASFIAGTIIAVTAGTTSDDPPELNGLGYAAMFGGLGGGLLFTILAYRSLFHCNAAGELYHQLDVTGDRGVLEIRDRREEIQRLVEQFNTRRR